MVAPFSFLHEILLILSQNASIVFIVVVYDYRLVAEFEVLVNDYVPREP